MTATYKTVKREVSEIAECHCNNCGSLLATSFDGRPIIGLVEHHQMGGYFSPILSDCTFYTFSLCESCLGQMFLDFKTPPELSGSLPPYSWKEEKKHIESRLKK
jgi:hypothetical protein